MRFELIQLAWKANNLPLIYIHFYNFNFLKKKNISLYNRKNIFSVIKRNINLFKLKNYEFKKK